MAIIPFGFTAQTAQATPTNTQNLGFTPDLRNYRNQQRVDNRMQSREMRQAPNGYENIYNSAMQQYLNNQAPVGGWQDPNAKMAAINDFRGQYAAPTGRNWNANPYIMNLAAQNYGSQWNGQTGKGNQTFQNPYQFGQNMLNSYMAHNGNGTGNVNPYNINPMGM